MNASVDGLAVAFACVWTGAIASSQTPAPDWSGFPGPGVSSAGDVNADGFDDVIVGGYGFDNGQVDEGRACVYLGSASGVAPTPVWTAESNQAGAYFGWAVAGAGDVNADGYDDVLVGAPYFDSDAVDGGRAFLYLGSATGPSTSPSWTTDGSGANWVLGSVLSTAGDVNGDGFDDVLIGIPGAGVAAVYRGRSSGVPVFAWQAGGPGSFGAAVSTAGDVNGDGFDDVIVGAPYTSNGETWEGRAHAYLGSSGGLSAVPFWVLESNVPFDHFGLQVGSAGDMDGDGFDDVAVTAWEEDQRGRTTVYRGGFPASLTSAWTGTGENESEYFGWWLSAGDVDGDGFDDLIVGAPHHDYVDGDTGRVVVFEGSSVGLSGPAWQATGDLQAHLGHMVGAADVNGDGYSDLVVTDDPLFDGDGSAYAYLGSHSGLDGPPRHRRPPRAPRVR